MPTVREIAQVAGVSKSAVSLVLNNSDSVSDKMRERVLRAIEELEQDTHEGQDVTFEDAEDSVKTIMLLHPSWHESSRVFRDLLLGIKQGALESEVHLQFMASNQTTPMLSDTLLFSDAALRPDGILLFEYEGYESHAKQLLEMRIPCLLVGAPSHDPRIPSVHADEVLAGYVAAQHLLQLGHRSIIVVTDQVQSAYIEERIEGYRKALAEFNLDFGAENIVTTGIEKPFTAQLADDYPHATGMLILNEATLKNTLPALSEQGYAIPNDLSVVTFDDTEIARHLKPGITSVKYPLYEEGYWSIKMMSGFVQTPSLVHFRLQFRATLVARKSCKAME